MYWGDVFIQKRTVKKTNTAVSALGFGAMRLPTKNGMIDKKEATQLINHAIDNGINLIDTAYLYHNGESESFLKSILEKRRDEILISTKLPVWFVKNEDDLEKYLNIQLEKLGVECIDFYYLHSLNYIAFKQLKEYNIFEFLDRIKREKKVKNIGFSYHDNYDSFKKIIDSYDWDMCLLQYNFIDDDAQAGTKGVKYAYDNDVSVFVMEPLKGGLLANNVPMEVKNKMDKSNITDNPSRWALRWVLNHKEVTCVLSGMGRICEVDENIKTTNDTPPSSIDLEELETYSNVKKIYNKLIKIPCTQCGYCMPCPYGVDIPACFKIYNNKYIFGESREYFQLSGLAGGNGSYAGKCRNCGVCLDKCPQKINIPREMVNVKSDLEFFGYDCIMAFVRLIGKPLAKWLLKFR